MLIKEKGKTKNFSQIMGKWALPEQELKQELLYSSVLQYNDSSLRK